MPRRTLERSVRAFQENLQRAGPAAAASYTMIGSIVLLGGLGYLVDSRWHSSPWGVLVGLLCGVAAGLYAVVMAAKQR